MKVPPATASGSGVSFFMTEAFTQRKDVSIRQQVTVAAPPMPLPASGVLLLAGLMGLWGARRKVSI